MSDINSIIGSIRKLANNIPNTVRIMEVCGTHTVNIQRSGIRSILPKKVKLISGPGCPVCVTPIGYIDVLIALANDGFIITTYGDMVKVPGSESSLAKERAKGADIRVIGSAFEALNVAKENPDKEVVFAGIGFETTTPPSADVVIRTKNERIDNFSILVAHKLVIPAMQGLLEDPDCAIDGFLCPGHVSVIIGADAYKPIVEKYHRPCVVGGFEPNQILLAIQKILEQIVNNHAEVDNVYSFAVKAKPHKRAQELMNEVFEITDTDWRGIGKIPESGLKLKPKYEMFDAEKKFGVKIESKPEPKGCRCGEIMKGLIDPIECPLFGKRCNPAEPIGPCMVSSEGVCQAWFKYSGTVNG